MKGKHKVIVKNNKLHYEFDLKRNITIIQGDSATGKTTLVDMIRQNMNLGEDSGIDLICDVPCRVLEGIDWKNILPSLSGCILFTDEGNRFVNTEEFASAVRNSDNYFVLITRESLHNLPYSVDEIYGIHSSGKYNDTKRVYQETYKIYSNAYKLPAKPKKVIVEDSNSGFDFFVDVCSAHNIECQSAKGKSNIFSCLKNDNDSDSEICVIADGAAIGSEINILYEHAKKHGNIKLYFPESFEWLILQSDIVKGATINQVLEHPEDFIDSQNFFSWERYFTKLLIQQTANTFLQYQKSKLNPVYLHEKIKSAITAKIKGITF